MPPEAAATHGVITLIKAHIGWIVGFFSLGMALASVLMAIGTMREKIVRAAQAAHDLKRELYAENGQTNYLPRSEYNTDIIKLQGAVIESRQEILAHCSQCRTDCHNSVRDEIKDIRNLVIALYREGQRRWKDDDTGGIDPADPDPEIIIKP